MRTRTETEDITALTASITSLQKELASCKRKIAELSRQLEDVPVVKNTLVFEVGERFTVIHPIPVTIEESKDETVVTFPDGGITGFGATETEALISFKNSIVDLYDDLTATPPEQLDKIPAGWLRTLKRVMKPIEQTDPLQNETHRELSRS